MRVCRIIKGTLSRRLRPRLRGRLRGREPVRPDCAKHRPRSVVTCEFNVAFGQIAPQLFDGRLIEENFAKQQQEEAYLTESFVALAKVYGSDPQEAVKKIERCRNSAEMVQKEFRSLKPRLQDKIMVLTDESRLWLDIGKAKMRLFESERPPRRLSWSQIASLTEIGVTLGRSAAGLPW